MSTVSSPIQQYAQFDPSKHPRGQPENAGEFAPKGGGSTQPSDKPDDSGGESPDVSQSSGAPAPQQSQPEQTPQPVQPKEASQEVVHVSSMDAMPDEAKTGFENHVLSPLRKQVAELDNLATNPMLGKRYAWESATHRGEKPGDPHAGSDGLSRWKAHATQAGYHADEAISSHPELNDLTARLDKHRGWGTEPSGKPVQKPAPRQGDEVQRVSNEEVMESPHWDEWHAGLGPERTMAQAASGMQGIHGREYAIRQHSPDKWQIISRKKQAKPEQQPAEQKPEIAADKTSQSLPKTDDPAHIAVGNRFGIPPETVKDILETHPDELARRDEYLAPSSGGNQAVGPTTDYEQHPFGTAKIDKSRHKSGDTDEAYVDFLTEFDPHHLKLSENEGGMSRHPSTQAYVEWAKQGMRAPPISVFDSSNGNGDLVSSNRRRVLAAQMAGTKVTAWHGRNNNETGLPLKFGDLKKAYDEELGKQQESQRRPSSTSSLSHQERNAMIEDIAFANRRDVRLGIQSQGVPKKLLEADDESLRQIHDNLPKNRKNKPTEPTAAKSQPSPEPASQTTPPDQSADDPEDLDDRGHASNWNEVIKDHGKATPQQLKHALRAVEHMRQHHASNPHLTPEQRTAMMGMLDSHHAKIQQALAANDKPEASNETPAAAESSPAPPAPKAGASVAERHQAVGQKIDLAPTPVKDLLRSLHNLRDTKRNGHVQTKELGANYAQEMYDHLKSNKRSGDGFGDVHDMSSELGHGAMGYSSPAGNLAIIPPKFKNDDFDVRYTLPHESQAESEAVQSLVSENVSPQPEPEASALGDSAEPEDAIGEDGSFPWEDQPSVEASPDHKNAADALNKKANLHKSVLGSKIQEMIGDDPLDVHAMHEAVLQTHKELDSQRQARNSAYDNLMAEHIGKGIDRTQFIANVRQIANSGGDLSSTPYMEKKFNGMARSIENYPEIYGAIQSSPGFDNTDIGSSLFDYININGGLESPIPLNFKAVSTEPIENELSAIDKQISSLSSSPMDKFKAKELKKQRTQIKQKLLRSKRETDEKHRQIDELLAKAASKLDQNAVEFSPDDPYYAHQKKQAEDEHSRNMESDPHYRSIWEQQQSDIDSTPFSRCGHKLRYEKIRRWLASSYGRWRKYARQLGFAWGAEEEALHPRAPGGEWTDKEGHAPGAPAPHAAKPATAPDEMPDMPLFSQPPPASTPTATPQPAATETTPPEPPVVAEQQPSAETREPGEDLVPTAEQQDARMMKSLTEREQTNQFMVAKYQETKDPTIRDQLIEDNTPLVMKAARKWAKNPSELDDYVQEGLQGLMTAIEKFDPTKKMSFAGFASYYISNGLHKQNRFLTPGERSKDEANRTKTQAASQLPQDEDRPSSMEQLAIATGRNPARPMEIMELQSAIADSLREDFSERDADAIQMRFGIGRYKDNPHEYPEIARKLGIGTEGARMIIKRSEPALMRRLKSHYTPEDYAKSAGESKDITEQDWRDATEKYGLSWDRCFQRGEPERYGMLDGQDAHVIAQALAEWYWNLPDRRDREKADHYAKQLGFNFGDAPAAPAAKPAPAPPRGGWGGSQEELHPRATETVTIAGKTYSGGEWIPAGQAALATPVEKSKIELVSKSGQQKNPATDIHAAFARIAAGDRKSSIGTGALTMVSMEDMRSQLPQYSKEELDREIRKMREADYYTMETGHGRTTPEMRAAGIQEGSDNLIWIARR